MEQFFKGIREATQEEKTVDLFAEVLRKVPEDEETWISMSAQLQGLLGFVCEGEPLQIVEKTATSVVEGRGFDSLRRLQTNYSAQFAYQGPYIYNDITKLNPDMGPMFHVKIDELEEIIDK